MFLQQKNPCPSSARGCCQHARLTGEDVQLHTRSIALCSTLYMFVPQIVVDLQSRLTALLVRMTAVEALLEQEPLLTGRYTAAPYRYISQVQCMMQHLLSYRPVNVVCLTQGLNHCTLYECVAHLACETVSKPASPACFTSRK